jgi:hypothetical protein
MGSVEEDRHAIQDDLKVEEALQREIKELAEEAEHLEAERLRRRALLGDGGPEKSRREGSAEDGL